MADTTDTPMPSRRGWHNQAAKHYTQAAIAQHHNTTDNVSITQAAA